MLNKAHFKFYLLSFLLITAILIFFSYPSFFLDFSIDEWSTLVKRESAHFAGFFRPYGIQLELFNRLYDIFGYNPIFFFVITNILRVFTALTIAIFVYEITKNNFTSLFSGIFFAVGFTGIQTTSEPVNLNVYLSLISLGFFIWYFLFSRKFFSVKNIFFMGIFLLVAVVFSPIRMNPIFLWAIIVDLIWLSIYKSKINFKRFLLRQTVIMGIFLSLMKLGIFSYGTSGQNVFLEAVNRTFSNVNLNTFNNILIGFGNVIFPNEHNMLVNLQPLFNLFMGMSFILLILILLYLSFKKREGYLEIFSFLVFIPFFYLTSWLVAFTTSNEVVIASFRRYLLPGLFGLSIGLGLLINILPPKKKQIFNLVILFFLLLTIFHAFSTYNFLNYQASFRDGFYSIKIWKQLEKQVPKLSKVEEGQISIFYFELDSSPKSRYSTENFFPGRAAILYGIPQETYKLSPNPHFTYSLDDLVLYVKDGSPLKRMGFESYQTGPISWDRVFAFKVVNGNLINIKQEVKIKVEKVLSVDP